MKKNDNKRNLFAVKDIVIIFICMVALVILFLILKISKETERNEQKQLSDIQEQIQNSSNDNAEYMSTKAVVASIMINEVNGQGWLELYNNGADDVDLEGYSICINNGEIKEIEKGQIIPAGKLLVIETKEALHTQEKNYITLLDKDAKHVSSMIVPKLNENESYGRVENGSIQLSYQKETKEMNNDLENILKKDILSFSVPGGFYQSAFALEINVPEGMEVYYTLDGTEPTLDSIRYQSAIQINNRSGSNYQYAIEEMDKYLPESIYMGTVVRAIAVDRSKKVVQRETQSYYIGIANNSDIYNIPVISITTNPENLFNYFEGIYVPGRSKEDAIAMDVETSNMGNYWNNWTKEAHIEYFEANKDKTYEANVELSMLKDYSIETHQKGFRFTKLEEEIMMGSGLQNNYHDTGKFIKIQTNKRDNIIKLREMLVNDLLKDTSVGTVEITPCTLFVDGEYWGAYMLREEVDVSYIRNAYMISDDERILIEKNGTVNDWENHSVYQEFYQFMSTTDMSVPANYEMAKEMMDIQSYLDYFCANVYLANADYGVDEASMWRTVSKGEGYADGRWRWVVGKLDNAMNNDIEGRRTTSTIDTYKMPELLEDKIFMSLIKNEEFREQLRITMKRMAEEIFTEEKVMASVQEISARTQKMALTSYRRFFGNATEKTYSNEIENVTEFFANRAEYILIYTDEVMEMNGQWFITESVEEERRANEQEDSTESDTQNTVSTGDNVLP